MSNDLSDLQIIGPHPDCRWQHAAITISFRESGLMFSHAVTVTQPEGAIIGIGLPHGQWEVEVYVKEAV